MGQKGAGKLKTVYWKVNPVEPETDIILKAAAQLKDLELVAFPTETVYGVGALANSSQAVAKIFAAKARPPRNPLLVHVSQTDQVKELVTGISETARLLMDKFWPGPLSLILPAREEVPPIVRGGKNSVGLRMPAHPVALALIDQAGPLAAPSANLSGRPSPLTADHVKYDLDGRIAAVLDAGKTGIGLESTIIDLSQDKYKVLRLGGLPLEKIQEVLGDKLEISKNESDELPHYRTASRVIIAKHEEDFQRQQDFYLKNNKKLAIVSIAPGYQHMIKKSVPTYELSISGNRSDLYTILREVEQAGIEVLLFTPIPDKLEGINRTLIDRILRIAEKETIGRV
jgi:L-threonylcarbamoyladenylate synthase